MEAEEKSEGGEAEPKQEQEAVQHQQQPEEQSDSHDQKHDLIDLGALVMMCRDLCRRLSPMIKSIYERGELRVIDKAQDADVDITIDAAVKEPSKEPSKEPIAMAAEMTQKMIVGSLQMRFPKLRVYGEEEDLVTGESDIVQQTSVVFEKEIPEQYRQLIASDVVVWVDPINGTKEFTDGVKSAVTTLIGICYRGRPIAGVIARPFSDQVVWGVVGLGAFGFRVDIALQHRDTARRIVCTSRSHFRPSMKAYVSACNPSGFVRAGGCGGKSLMVIEGAADAYVFPSLGTKKWDTAAPEAILLALGGRLTKPDGSLYDYEPRNCTAMNNEGFVATLFDKGYHESYLAHNLNMEQSQETHNGNENDNGNQNDNMDVHNDDNSNALLGRKRKRSEISVVVGDDDGDGDDKHRHLSGQETKNNSDNDDGDNRRGVVVPSQRTEWHETVLTSQGYNRKLLLPDIRQLLDTRGIPKTTFRGRKDDMIDYLVKKCSVKLKHELLDYTVKQLRVECKLHGVDCGDLRRKSVIISRLKGETQDQVFPPFKRKRVAIPKEKADNAVYVVVYVPVEDVDGDDNRAHVLTVCRNERRAYLKGCKQMLADLRLKNSTEWQRVQIVLSTSKHYSRKRNYKGRLEFLVEKLASIYGDGEEPYVTIHHCGLQD